MTKNKDPDKFLKQFNGIFEKIITVPIENETNSISSKILLKIAKKNNYKTNASKNIDEAFKKITSKKKKVICVFGSLYLCGSVLSKN